MRCRGEGNALVDQLNPGQGSYLGGSEDYLSVRISLFRPASISGGASSTCPSIRISGLRGNAWNYQGYPIFGSIRSIPGDWVEANQPEDHQDTASVINMSGYTKNAFEADRTLVSSRASGIIWISISVSVPDNDTVSLQKFTGYNYARTGQIIPLPFRPASR